MKVAIQYYALLLIFAIAVLVIPSLLNFSICFNNLNQTSSYVTEIIEVNEGLNENSLSIINELKSRNPEINIDVEKIKINAIYNVYKIQANTEMRINILNLSYHLNSSKLSRRVIY